MSIESLARFPLAQLPTPIEELKSLSRELGGPALLIKRDDQTGLALGGNKTRKLEFLVGQALEQDADTLVTAGAAQSNHCRQTAAAAARAGLRCELLLNGTKPEVPNGNVLLDELLGARIDDRPLLRVVSRKKEIGRRRPFAQSGRQWKLGSWCIECS
jgi:D-cysteine desulfhydrase